MVEASGPTVPLTPPQMDRTWAMLCHVSVFSAMFFPLGNLLGPLIVWLSKKDEDPDVDLHGKASLNFQVTMMIAFGIYGFAVFAGGLMLAAHLSPSIAQNKGPSDTQIVSTGAVIALAVICAMALGLFSLVQVVVNSVRAYDGRKPNYWPGFSFFK